MTTDFPTSPSSNRGFNYPNSGPNNALEYMASGLPHSTYFDVSSSMVNQVDFQFLTSEIYVKNDGTGSLSVGWSENGVKGNSKYVLAQNQSVTFRIRVKSIFLTSDVPTTANVTAAMTTIPRKTFPVLTGSAANAETGLPDWRSGSLDRIYGYDPGIG